MSNKGYTKPGEVDDDSLSPLFLQDGLRVSNTTALTGDGGFQAGFTQFNEPSLKPSDEDAGVWAGAIDANSSLGLIPKDDPMASSTATFTGNGAAHAESSQHKENPIKPSVGDAELPLELILKKYPTANSTAFSTGNGAALAKALKLADNLTGGDSSSKNKAHREMGDLYACLQDFDCPNPPHLMGSSQPHLMDKSILLKKDKDVLMKSHTAAESTKKYGHTRRSAKKNGHDRPVSFVCAHAADDILKKASPGNEKIHDNNPHEYPPNKSSAGGCGFGGIQGSRFTSKLCPDFHLAHNEVCCHLLTKLCQPSHHTVPAGLQIHHIGQVKARDISDEEIRQRVAWLREHRHIMTRESLQSVLLDRTVEAWERVPAHPSTLPPHLEIHVKGQYKNTRNLLISHAYAAQYQYHIDVMALTWRLMPHLMADPIQAKADLHETGTASKAEATTRTSDAGSKDTGLNVNVTTADFGTEAVIHKTGVGPKTNSGPKADTGANADTGPKTNTAPQAGTGPEAVTHETDVGPKTDAGPKTGTDSKAGTGPKTDVRTSVDFLGKDLFLIIDDTEDIVMVEHDEP